MKTRFGSLLAISVLIMLALSLAACERDRPAPTPTCAAGGAAGATTRTPQANLTTVALPTTASGAGAVTPTAPMTATTTSGGAAAEAATSGGATTAGGGSGQPSTYTVVKGDTLAKIAAKFGVTQESIVSLNNLSNPNLLTPGQQLKVGAASPTGSASSGSTEGSSGSAKASTYTVRAGDTLMSIAQKLGVARKDLQTLNNIANPDQIYVGQVLRVPGAASTQGTATTGSKAKTYTVQRGDTLAAIATRFGVTIAQLKQANNIANANQIYTGQVLTIPTK